MHIYKSKFTTVLTTAAILTSLGANLTSCTDEHNDLTIDKNEEYARKFIKEFGIYDMQHDWNAATRYRLSIASEAARHAETLTLYTSQPGTYNCLMVGQYPASSQSVTFDIAKTSEHIYFEFTDGDGRIVSAGYHSLKNGSISETRASRASDECTATIGDGIKPGNVVSAQPWTFPEEIQAFWRKLVGDTRFEEARDSNTPIKATEVFKTYMIDGKQTEQGTPQSIEYMIRLVSQNTGTFGEQICNVTKFREKLHPENGVEYVMAEDGPATITYFYGATAHYNKLGYLYYKDGATDEEIMHAPRFIIIDDAQPHHNIYYGNDPTTAGTAEFNGGMHPSVIIDTYEKYLNGDTDQSWVSQFKYITGTKHKLVYFGEGNEFEKGHPGSYTFPAGTHIVFFVIKAVGDKEDVPWRRSYSLPRLNEIMNYTTGHSGQCKIEHNPETSIPIEAQIVEPNADFVTYSWYGYTMMGIEDGIDHDVNDMMFFVNAKIKDDDIIDMDDKKKPEPQSWLLAVEDLGNIGDFDFNDLVVKISHVSGTNSITVQPLASGGTLPIRLFYHDNDNHIGADRNLSHINEWFGVDAWSEPINAYTHSNDAMAIEIPVDENFSMSSSPLVIEGNRMGGFYVKVNNKPGQGMWTDGVVDIAAPQQGNVPQMLCLPGDWAWPIEGNNIRDAYPEIGAWISDRNTNTDWHQHPEKNRVVKRKN